LRMFFVQLRIAAHSEYVFSFSCERPLPLDKFVFRRRKM